MQLHTDQVSMSPVAVASKVELPPLATEEGVNCAVQLGPPVTVKVSEQAPVCPTPLSTVRVHVMVAPGVKFPLPLDAPKEPLGPPLVQVYGMTPSASPLLLQV
ncbi:MAG: hypothetical protein HYZ92_02985 [Candidatus Omnitrophica bacterium]|nr:hypothetical protein [Candidatus Omnitrophota bacterium]